MNIIYIIYILYEEPSLEAGDFLEKLLPHKELERFYESYHSHPKTFPDFSTEPATADLTIKILAISGSVRQETRHTAFRLETALEAEPWAGSVATELILIKKLVS